MKIEKLKPLVKAILTELYKRKLNENSGTLDNYQIELEGLVIPGISTENDLVYVDTNIEYEGTKEIPARGMYGPPEKSSPAEGGDFDIIDNDIGRIAVWSGGMVDNKKEYNIRQLNPQQQQILKQAVNDYIEEHVDDIRDKVLDSVSDIEPDEPDYFEETIFENTSRKWRLENSKK